MTSSNLLAIKSNNECKQIQQIQANAYDNLLTWKDTIVNELRDKNKFLLSVDIFELVNF